MPIARFQLEDGRIARFEVPDGTTPEQAQQMMVSHFANTPTQPEAAPQEPTIADQVAMKAINLPGELRRTAGNLVAGGLRGAGSIGATLLSPIDIAKDAIAGKGLSLESNRARRAAIDDGLRLMGADTESLAYSGGKLGAEIAGTSGIGGAIVAPGKVAGTIAGMLRAKGAASTLNAMPTLAKYAPNLATAIETGGMSAGDAGMATRIAGGALSGGAMAGMANPEDAGTSAVIGGVLPGAVKVAGKVGMMISEKMRVDPEVAQLAERAKSLGIDIPADRIAKSKLLNAAAESLNYLPFSGRTATEAKMNSQIRTALAKTFGENTDNLSKDVLNKAQQRLGQRFDDFLTQNKVKVDQQLFDDLQSNLAKAKNELSADNYRIVENQVKDLWGKIDGGVIDGNAAYNVKKTLDRLGRGNGNEAFHAKEVRNSLMGALKRSVSQDKAQEFSSLQRQYANLKSLKNLAGNTAEGEVSMARLGNIDSRNTEVQDLARIAATFAKGRESPHGAMQRVAMGAMGGGALAGSALAGMAAPVAAGLTGGRLANLALNSQGLKNLLIGQPTGAPMLTDLLANPATRAGLLSLQSR